MTGMLTLLPVVAVAAAVIFAPGLALAYMLRLRGLILVGAAPAIGVTAIGVSAILAQLLGLSWGLGTASGTLIMLVLAAALIGWLLRGVSVPSRPVFGWQWIAIAIAAGAVFGIARMALIIGEPGNISQTNDAVFHLNALRFIEDSASASSFTLTQVIGSSGFYPAAWHGVASLVVMLTGSGLPEAANAVSLAVAGPVWSCSLVAFVWAITGGRKSIVVITALLAPTLVAAPFLLQDFGIIYPYALSVTILPGVLSLLWCAESPEPMERRRQVVAIVLATLVGLVGIGLAQPAVLVAWAIVAGCYALWLVIPRWQGADRESRPKLISVAIIIVVTLGGVWVGIALLVPGLWGPHKPWYRALGEMLINAPFGEPAAIIVSILSIIGFAAALRRVEFRWLCMATIILLGLTLVALSVANPLLRFPLRPWYGDSFRLLGLLPIVIIPLAAFGVSAILRWAASRSARSAYVAGTLLVALALVETAFWSINDRRHGEDSYAIGPETHLSEDEIRLLEALPDLVEPDARILGNPSTGAAFGYAISGLDVFPRTWQMPADEDFQRLRSGLADLAADPAVCDSISRLGIDYVLDFGDGDDEIPGRWAMPGMTGFDSTEGLELVAQQGDASLWRITGCT